MFKGIRGPGRMGGGRVTQRGLTVVEVIAEPEPAARARRRPGPQGRHRGGAHRCLGPRPKLGGGDASTLDAAAFEARFNMPLVHEAVRAELNARRRGTASTKTRGEVSGGGAKPWRQKGTGRARAGSSRSPIWTGGGTVFGPTPRHYTFKVNRKARRAALRSALSVHAERESLAVFDAAAFDAPSTKQAAELLADWGAGGPTLVLLGDRARRRPASRSATSRASRRCRCEDAGVADIDRRRVAAGLRGGAAGAAWLARPRHRDGCATGKESG